MFSYSFALRFTRSNITYSRSLTTSIIGRNKFKDWKSLTKCDKQTFIHQYIDLYKEKHPCSKSNVMYRSLAEGMDEHDDTPYVFGIIYNELRSVANGESKDNTSGLGILGDPAFKSLLIT